MQEVSKDEEPFNFKAQGFIETYTSTFTYLCTDWMDLIHMTPSVRGYNYIITAVDYLSKYCEMQALKEKNAKEVAKFIYEDLICRWGCSEYHITDQGREFVNSINTNLLEMCGTKQRITSAFHPQANGLCEHLNRSTQETLAKTMTEEKDWVDMIPTVAFLLLHSHTELQ